MCRFVGIDCDELGAYLVSPFRRRKVLVVYQFSLGVSIVWVKLCWAADFMNFIASLLFRDE